MESTADLIKKATDQMSTLVRDEIRLAQAELAEKGRHAGIGIGMFGGAAMALHFGIAALLVAAGLALGRVMPGWAAALIIGVALLLIAGVEALIGRRHFQQTTPLKPERTIRSVQSDIDTMRSSR
ncbi:phage holin family protein [Allorhizocola rhizosphaerae]|uniref:phage holin family protein n=1 Tax=Allorhizocola rhizosphaerae TaxID=1872709 RepID=UPI000E3CC2E2|nr:phage holin family protein [Allorhizocola rhizosphaerae]